jgi:DNA-binding PadR family transcriptional regulator
MKGNLLTIVDESKYLNSKVFSLVRLKILWSLSELGIDGATARQIRTGLNIGNEGTTYANLNALTEMGYLKKEIVSFEKKEIELYSITQEGLEEWEKIKKWLGTLINGDS